MARLEPWRLQELALLLSDLIVTLRSGKNPEWANVFVHFSQEVARLGEAAGDRNALRRLAGSIRLCLAGSGGLSRLVLDGASFQEKQLNNRRLVQLRARLAQALTEIEERLIEFVN